MVAAADSMRSRGTAAPVAAAGAGLLLASAACSQASAFLSANGLPAQANGHAAQAANLRGVAAAGYSAPSSSTSAPSSVSVAPMCAVLGGAFAIAAGRRSSMARKSAGHETYQQESMMFPAAYEKIADTNPRDKKTGIVCTIGPKSWSPEKLIGLMEQGMTCLRCNMSHGDHEEQSMKLANLEKAYEMRPEFKGKMKILMDTRGPEIRTGMFEVYNSKKELKAGQDFKLIATDYEANLKIGDENKVAITYEKLPRDVKPGQRILIQDGTVVLDVKSVGDGEVDCTVVNDCKLGEKKNVNVPGVKVDIPVVGERELFDIKDWAVPAGADYIALSFVQSAKDVKDCRAATAGASKPIQIVSKIENVEGLKMFDEILAESDGIMVARGDLGMEIPMEKIWMAQKMMIMKAKAAGKFVITATEMLASMEDKPFPTRAEACDVANAVLDGTDMVMLSSEVAMGDFPVETVAMMSRICQEAEHAMDLAKK
eukprot:TRINITY_DN135_c0_g2_i2.p1 TRINITY_DN135_c0_g2~~TRINITY_DN135_c0_g2_i2.p1  ORF type:complete len:484 (+),score=175.70 TRINITY_DN135_c0_g2_i2:80-1531(+)